MRCISPLKASLNYEGDIVYNSKKAIPGLLGFEFECRKCLPCRLNLAREKAIRCVHEAKMHKGNIFLTLTYDEEHLTSDRLQYKDFQNFMKSLRETVTRKAYSKSHKDELYMPMMVTGEYGELNKRPHWHALIFNYFPDDAKPKYKTKDGEHVYTSALIDKLWKKGNTEFGSVTMDSAGYVARYAAKKLVHGHDQDHDYHPIHKTSSRRAIGRSWIEKYYKHTFDHGFVTLPNGQTTKIPRYYTDWVKKHKPDVYIKYATGKRIEIQTLAEISQRKEELEFHSNAITYKGGAPYPTTRSKVKETILQSKFKKLQEHLKL